MKKVKVFEYLNLFLVSPHKGKIESDINFYLDLKNAQYLKKLKHYASQLRKILKGEDIDILIIPVLLTPQNLEEQIKELRKNFNIPNVFPSQMKKEELELNGEKTLDLTEQNIEQNLKKTKANQNVFYPFVLYNLVIDLEKKYNYDALTKLLTDLTEEQKIALSKIIKNMIKDLFIKEKMDFDIIVYPSFIPITHLNSINDILSKVLSPVS